MHFQYIVVQLILAPPNLGAGGRMARMFYLYLFLDDLVLVLKWEP